jgi:hypothetical protein
MVKYFDALPKDEWHIDVGKGLSVSPLKQWINRVPPKTWN